jgi:hypothetical protein
MAAVTVETPEEGDVASLAEREKSFYNEKGKTSYHLVRRWIWRAIGEFRRNEEAHELYDAAGKDVLDYGCGPGYLAKHFVDASPASTCRRARSSRRASECDHSASRTGAASSWPTPTRWSSRTARST